MPRSPRVEYEGALYHVMCRGDRQEAIFRDEKDRVEFLVTLGEVCGRTGWKIVSYVLMKNHYHLLVETPKANLVKGMQWFQGTYTARFNARHKVKGHLFQGRYKAIPVETGRGDYARVASDYIHLNPARAGLVDEERKLKSYRWSSFPAFCGGGKTTEWLDGRCALEWSHLRVERGRDRRAYERDLEKRALACRRERLNAPEEWKNLRRGWFLGGEEFRERLEVKITELVRKRKRASYGSQALRAHDEREAMSLLTAGAAALALKPADLSKLAQNDVRKQGLAWLIKSRTVVGDEWLIGNGWRGHRSNISRAVSRFRKSTERSVSECQKLLMHICTD